MRDQPKTNQNVVWHLMFFHPDTERLVTQIELTEQQVREIWPCVMTLPKPADPDPFGDYLVGEVYIGASAR